MCVWEEEVDGWAKRPRPPSPFFLCPLDLQIKANMRLKILALIGNMRPSEILVLFEKTVFFSTAYVKRHNFDYYFWEFPK